MNVNELLEAVRAAMAQPIADQDGFTVADIATALGRTDDAVRSTLKQMLKSGTAEVVRMRRPRMDGIVTVVSGYRLK